MISPDRLNILAEVLCFGDREFYKDWWNAKTVEEVIYIHMPSEKMFLTLSSSLPFSRKLFLTICLDCVHLSLGTMAAVLENVEHGMFLNSYSFEVIFFLDCDQFHFVFSLLI